MDFELEGAGTGVVLSTFLLGIRPEDLDFDDERARMLMERKRQLMDSLKKRGASVNEEKRARSEF